jgi:hypothetical protein
MDLVTGALDHFPRHHLFATTVPSIRTAGNSGRTAGYFAVLSFQYWRRPRISAGNATPAADYFLQKQQKQRELPFIG